MYLAMIVMGLYLLVECYILHIHKECIGLQVDQFIFGGSLNNDPYLIRELDKVCKMNVIVLILFFNYHFTYFNSL